jgi:heterotetrameric sarcosine oxidase gamma subunit
MTDLIVGPAHALLSLDLWDAADHAAAAVAVGAQLPGAGRAQAGAAGTVLRVGPRRWWLHGAAFSGDEIAQGLNDSGTVTAVAGGWVHVQLTGPAWRDLVMECGLIDAQSPDFGPGSVAVTLLSHARCVLHVVDSARCDVFVPASYAHHCLAQWRDLGWQQVPV